MWSLVIWPLTYLSDTDLLCIHWLHFCSEPATVLRWTWEYRDDKGCCCLEAKSCPSLLQPLRTVAHQAPLSVGFPRQEYWSGLHLPDPGIKPTSPAWQVDSLYHWAIQEALMMKAITDWTTASCIESNLCPQQHLDPRVILNHWADSPQTCYTPSTPVFSFTVTLRIPFTSLSSWHSCIFTSCCFSLGRAQSSGLSSEKRYISEIFSIYKY